jgi:hypothetical protein
MERFRVRGARAARVLVVVFAVAVAALFAVAGPASAKPKVDVSLRNVSQESLAGKGKLKVKVESRSHHKLKARVSGKALQDGGEKWIAGREKLSLRPGASETISLALTSRGSSLVQSCLETRIRAKAAVHRKGKWRGAGKATEDMSRDPARCDGETPVGVDLADAARCDPIAPIGAGECLFPYPNDYYTEADPDTDTGRRLALAPDATPENVGGVHVNPAEINTSDGFSPGALIVTRVPGMDTPAAFEQTGPVPITNMGEYDDPGAPIVLIDAATGERQLIWTELDSNASTPEDTDLLIHPGKNLREGHRYIVAMRDLEDAQGNTLPAPEGFRLYRDKIPTAFPAIENRREHMNAILGKLKSSGIERSGLYMAWDFTVASTRNITERMLHIRDDGLAQLGDTSPGNGVINGAAPDYTITDVKTAAFPLDTGTDPLGSHAVENVREVTGTFEVPCYIHPDCEAPTAGRFAPDADGLPTQATGPGSVYNARFTCNIPQSAVTHVGPGPNDYDVTSPVRPSMYGHGLFGDYTEVHTGDVRKLGNDHGVITCATDFIGMYEDDVVPEAIPALADMSKFTPLPDRLQQGFLDFVYLGRLLAHPNGLADDPAFEFNGNSALATDEGLFYYGNSQGGIAGGALTAIEPDITRTVLYVPGMNYSLLLTRSVDFEDYALILYPSYPDEGSRPLLLSMIQSMWDRGEPNGYANHMTTNPLPRTPAHKVLIEMAYGDHQVANVSTEVEARTIGAPLRQPALDAFRLPAGFDQPFFDIPPLGALPGPAEDGNGFFVWDIGPKRMDPGELGTDPPPITNTAPNDSYGVDPHDTVIRQTPEVRAQIAQFLKTDGTITDPCGAAPCYAAGWTGP